MTPTRRVSIKDVARDAGVSVTTVSHALNDKGRLNPGTRQRVRDVAERLGYRPNPAARSLVSGRTGLIAVMASFPTGIGVELADFGYFSDLVVAATGVAVARDHALVVAPPSTSGFIWDRVPLDGVIVIDPMVGEPALPVLRERQIPFVMTSVDPSGDGNDCVVSSEDHDSTVAILDHLASRGARRVGMLSPPLMNAFLQHSLEAYHQWCERSGQPEALEILDLDELIAEREAALARALDRVLSAPDAPDALYVPIELVGVAVERVLVHEGVGIPHELMLATTHDAGRAITADPPMTTIEWDYQDIGRRAAALLLDILDGTKTPPCRELVPGRIVARASTAR